MKFYVRPLGRPPGTPISGWVISTEETWIVNARGHYMLPSGKVVHDRNWHDDAVFKTEEEAETVLIAAKIKGEIV